MGLSIGGNMKKIVFADWMGSRKSQVLEYSVAKRNEIINAALEQGLQIMMFKLGSKLVIYTDNGKFRQR
jgi:hypothetical protein